MAKYWSSIYIHVIKQFKNRLVNISSVAGIFIAPLKQIGSWCAKRLRKLLILESSRKSILVILHTWCRFGLLENFHQYFSCSIKLSIFPPANRYRQKPNPSPATNWLWSNFPPLLFCILDNATLINSADSFVPFLKSNLDISMQDSFVVVCYHITGFCL